jgi:N6-L-threonylcarbamoyladenine synthase
VIDRLAKEGKPDAIDLVWPMRRRGSLEFSFSGLKSDVMRWVQKHGLPGDDQTLRDLCASFQRRVVDTLVGTAVEAATREKVGALVLAGGVAANRELRERARARTAERGLRLVVPPFRACTDNAAMIAYAGAHRLAAGENDMLSLETSPSTALARVTRKGRGARA